MKFKENDIVYDNETDQLGYVCAVHKTRGYETSYNIVFDEGVTPNGFYFTHAQCSVYNFDNHLTRIGTL